MPESELSKVDYIHIYDIQQTYIHGYVCDVGNTGASCTRKHPWSTWSGKQDRTNEIVK